MPDRGINFPGEFINRKAEQEIFENLLHFNDDARLLAIEDKQGTGKTTLLEMLQYKCKYVLEHPVGLIQLEVSTINSAFVFIETLRDSIGLSQSFEQFDHYNQARVGKVAAVFAPAAAPINVQGTVAAGQAAISGSNPQLIGAQVNYYGSGEWTSAQEEQARRRCIKAFYEDLKSLYDETPLVVLLDSFDRCSSDLKPWLRDEFILPLAFHVKTRPQRLLIVLAGRELPDYKPRLHLVRSSCPLSGWEKEHVVEFLKVHKYGKLLPEDVDIVWDKIQRGFSIQQALVLAEALMS